MEVCLKDLSKTILGKYEVICDGKVLQNTEENAARKLIVKGISAAAGLICVQVMEQNIVSNDMDAGESMNKNLLIVGAGTYGVLASENETDDEKYV